MPKIRTLFYLVDINLLCVLIYFILCLYFNWLFTCYKSSCILLIAVRFTPLWRPGWLKQKAAKVDWRVLILYVMHACTLRAGSYGSEWICAAWHRCCFLTTVIMQRPAVYHDRTNCSTTTQQSKRGFHKTIDSCQLRYCGKTMLTSEQWVLYSVYRASEF